MASADPLASADAVPAVDAAARALDARRRHHRQMLRRGIVVGLIVAIVGLFCALAVPVVNQLRASLLLEAAGYRVVWQNDEENWLSGGVTSVAYKQGSSWLAVSRDVDLKILHRLLNVESLDLAECMVTEGGLASLSGLDHLRSLSLARMNHLRHDPFLSPETGMSDECLLSIPNLSRLRRLTLSGNRITDKGLAMIARLPEMEELDLDATDVTDAGLLHLQGLKKLKSLSLGGTFVTPQGTSKLQSALPGLEISFDITPEVERHLKLLRNNPR